MKMCYKQLQKVFFCFLFVWSYGFARDNLFAYSIVDTWEQGDCNLVVLKNEDGHQTLLKMIIDPDPDEQALLLVDYLGARLAALLDLPINKVELSLPDENPYKKLATLHEWAPGVSVEDHLPWEGFTLHQRYRHPDSPYYQKFGPLPQEKAGLTRDVLKTMARHPDLARIAALDTFLGNADRSESNLFYDPEKGHFFGIDLAASFRSPLATIAIKQILVMVNQGFSVEEFAALEIYKQTLQSLIDQVSIEDVRSWCKEAALASGLERCNKMRTLIWRFSDNYSSTLRLIEVCEELLANRCGAHS